MRKTKNNIYLNIHTMWKIAETGEYHFKPIEFKEFLNEGFCFEKLNFGYPTIFPFQKYNKTGFNNNLYAKYNNNLYSFYEAITNKYAFVLVENIQKRKNIFKYFNIKHEPDDILVMFVKNSITLSKNTEVFIKEYNGYKCVIFGKQTANSKLNISYGNKLEEYLYKQHKKYLRKQFLNAVQ